MGEFDIKYEVNAVVMNAVLSKSTKLRSDWIAFNFLIDTTFGKDYPSDVADGIMMNTEK